MSTTRYVLRAHYFGYNDECFYVSGSHIHHVFSQEEIAIAEWKNLEIQAAREYPLHEIESFFNGDKTFLLDMDQFTFSRCGEHILDEHGWPIQEAIPDALNDDDTFEFINRAKMNSYQVITFTDEDQFYTIWLTQQHTHLMAHDECTSCLIYDQHIENLHTHLKDLLYIHDQDPYVIQGHIEQLSQHPTLLYAAIKSQKNLTYNEKKHQLEIHNYDHQALQMINHLLTQPLYEYKAHTLEEIMALEKSLIQDHYWDEEDC